MSLRTPLLGCLLASTTYAGAEGSTAAWLNRHVLDRIQVSGRRVIGYHMQRVDGDREAFKSLTYSGRGGRQFTDSGQVNIGGRNVLGVFNFDIQLTDDRYADPDTRRFSVDYNRGPISVNMGDIRGSLLNTNSFASFSRSLKGVSAGYKQGRLALKGVRSEAKGNATTISIQGENSVGPYFLRSGRIAKDSVSVRVDGQEARLLQDYVVNYDSGTITFNNRIIPPTSTLVVTYESLGTGFGTGTVEGVGASYDMGRYGKIGFTTIEQRPTSERGLNTRTDLFQGFGDPSVPYFLTFEPLRSRPILVKLQGVIQVEGAHYRFDAQNPAVFYFLFPVPATSNIDVTYTPRPTQTVDGARRVVGFDYRLPIGKDGKVGYIDYNQATGSLSSDANPMRGTARGINARYDLSGVELRASWRDVPNTFVGIESRGFLRNERSLEWGLDRSSGPWRYGLSHDNSIIGTRQSDSDGKVAFRNSRSTRARAYTTYSPGSGANWTLEHNRIAGNSASGNTRFDTTALTGSLRQGRLLTSLGFDKTVGRGPVSAGISNTEMRSVSLDTARLAGSYFAGKAWSLTGKASVSQVQAGNENGQGTDFTLAAGYRPSGKLSVELNHTQSRSGELATLAGFRNGLGLGYDGNGFSSGQSSTGLAPGGGTDYRATTLSTTMRANDRLSVAARLSDVLASGSVSSNSVSRTYALDLDWSLGKRHQTGFSISNGRTKFLSSINSSDATMIGFYFHGTPKGPWSYRLAADMLLSGGSTTYAQDSFGFDFSLTHRLDEKQRLNFALRSGQTRGYLPQDEFYAGISYEHQLWQNISLVSSYRWRQVHNLDSLVRAGAYRSSGFDIELAFDFVP